MSLKKLTVAQRSQTLVYKINKKTIKTISGLTFRPYRFSKRLLTSTLLYVIAKSLCSLHTRNVWKINDCSMMASYTMASIGLVIFGLCVLLVPIASSKRCTYDCEWEDEELTLCDDRFVYSKMLIIFPCLGASLHCCLCIVLFLFIVWCWFLF